MLLTFPQTKTILKEWATETADCDWNYAKRVLSRQLVNIGIPSKVTKGMWLTFNHLLNAFERNTPYRMPMEQQLFYLETYLRVYLNTRAGKNTSLKPNSLKHTKKSKSLDQAFAVWAATYNLDLRWNLNWNRLATVLTTYSGFPKENVNHLKYALETMVGYIGDINWRTQRELLRIWIYCLSVSFNPKSIIPNHAFKKQRG